MRKKRGGSSAGGRDPFMGPLPAEPGCDCHICRPERSYDPVDRRTIDTILRCGWQVMAVSDDGPCDCGEDEHAEHAEPSDEPAFAYTVGLGHRCGHPELLMTGLDTLLMHRVLNGVAARVMAGRRLQPGDVLEGALGRVPVVVEAVSDEGLGKTVLWSGWFHRRPPEALMLVWPTTSGIFDWQPGAPAILAEKQPRRWREPMAYTGAIAPAPEWLLPVPADHMAFTCSHVLQDGEPVLWLAREEGPDGGEDWSAHCGAARHADQDIQMTHMSHLVRAAPSINELAHLPLGWEAWRETVDTPWVTRPLDPPEG